MTSSGQRLLIHHARLFTPSQPGQTGWLLVESGRIRSIGYGQAPDFPEEPSLQRLDARGNMLLPGFIDLHVHGAVGHELMDASPTGLEAMARFYASHGVTGFLATTWTASRDSIQKALELVEEMQGPIQNGSTVLGVHLEGPYLHPARCGAQEASHIRRAAREEALQFLDTGVIRLLALAPEFEENQWLIEECVKRGITVSAAHTTASYEQMQTAVARGVSQVTHTFNAMEGLGHREPGTVGAALTMPQLLCELIADNVHVHPAAQRILVDAKTPAGVILITDAIRPAGLPAGDYILDERPVNNRTGAVRLANGTLAGSILTMERALQNICSSTGRPLTEMWPASSLNAARSIGISDRKGSLEAGKDADLVLLDEAFQVHLTIAQGQIVYQG